MTIRAYLIIGRSKTINIRKSRPDLSSDEVAFQIAINLPNDFFERVIPTIDVQVPKEAIYNPEATLVLDLMSSEIANKLRLEVSEVRDGLQEMMRKKLQSEDREHSK